MDNSLEKSTVERIIEICKEKKIPISKLEKDLGYGNGYLNPKKIKDVKSNRLFEILDYLNMPQEEFFGKEKPATISGDGKLGDIDLSSATDRQRELIRRILGWSDIQVDALLSVTQSPPTNQ